MVTGNPCDKKLNVVVGFASDTDSGRLQKDGFAFARAICKIKIHGFVSPYMLAAASGLA